MVDLLPELQFAIAMFAVYGTLFGIIVGGLHRRRAVPFILLGIAINLVFMFAAIFQNSFSQIYQSNVWLFYVGTIGFALAAVVAGWRTGRRR